MARLPVFVSIVLLATGCATMIKGATQEVTITTPGVEGARCKVENDYFRYTVNPPRTFQIERTSQPYQINCVAPGNRFKTAILDRAFEETAAWNVTNGVIPGVATDATSGALFRYPDLIAIDFSDMKPQPMPLPYYQTTLAENPLIVDMEEFRPGYPALQRDRGTSASSLQRRTDIPMADTDADMGSPSMGAGVSDGTGVYSPSAGKVVPEDAAMSRVPATTGGGGFVGGTTDGYVSPPVQGPLEGPGGTDPMALYNIR